MLVGGNHPEFPENGVKCLSQEVMGSYSSDSGMTNRSWGEESLRCVRSSVWVWVGEVTLKVGDSPQGGSKRPELTGIQEAWLEQNQSQDCRGAISHNLTFHSLLVGEGDAF